MSAALISRELSLQSRVHQCGIKHTAFEGLTTTEQRKDSFRKVILDNQLQEKLGAEFAAVYGEPV